MGRKSQLASFFSSSIFLPSLFFFKLSRSLFLLSFPECGPFLASKNSTNPQVSLIRQDILEKAWTLHQNTFCSESRDIYCIGLIATCSHKDYCVILSADEAAARCWLILRVWSSKKGKKYFKKQCLTSTKILILHNHLVVLCFKHRFSS